LGRGVQSRERDGRDEDLQAPAAGGPISSAGRLGVAASSASASVWKDHGTNVSKAIEIGLTGGEIAEAGKRARAAKIHLVLTNLGWQHRDNHQIRKQKAVRTFGELSSCTLNTAEGVGLPWTVDVNTSDLTITSWHTKRTFKAGCATTEINKTVGSVTVTLLKPD